METKTRTTAALGLALLAPILAGLGASSALGQTLPAAATAKTEAARFEVASIRPVGPEELRAMAERGGFAGIQPCSGAFEITPGQIRIVAATVFRLMAAAYGQPCAAALNLKLIAGGPGWLQTDAFHIQATLPAGTPHYTFQELQDNEAPALQALIRNLLADRFHLSVKRTTKETSIYNVYFVKEGKVKPSADQSPTELSLVSGARGNFDMALDREAGIVRMRATAIPLSRLITPMQGRDGRMVFDRTGMTGVYDIAPITIDVGPSGPGVSVWPEILQGLGFRVESTRGTVEFLTIEQLEWPSEN